MKCIITGILVVMQLMALSQTCIIVYVSNQGIVAGADRKYQQTMSGAGHSVYFGKKIFVTAGCAWAFSGADYYDTIHTICKEVCSSKGALKNLPGRLQKRMQDKAVIKAMQLLVAAGNAEQKKKFRGNLAEIIFFKRENGAYKAYRMTISMPGVFNNDATLHFDLDSVTATKNTVGVLVLGHSGSFSGSMHPEKWTHPADMIRSLIRRQAAATPDDVSKASDIMEVSAKGFRWVLAEKTR